MNTTALNYSPQQQAVIDFVSNGKGSAFVEAVAGAGKTTTLIGALKETDGNVAFCAYNRKIADEIKGKVAKLHLGNRVKVGTFHSFGLAAWRRAYPNVKAGPDAVRLKNDMTLTRYRQVKSPQKLDAFALKLCGLAKQRALGLFGDIDDRSRWFDIVDHFDMAYDLEHDVDEFDHTKVPGEGPVTVEAGVELAIRTLKYHRELSPQIINFDDMIYMPVVSGIRMYTNDWVFVDEAQDTNPARRALARKMLANRGRAIFVGDRHQAIYGFTGADNDAVDQIVREFNCQTLPLTVTYRCPKSVVETARQVVSHIEAHETAPDGEVITQDYEGDFLPAVKDLTVRDAILCRKTKPLVDLAFSLIRKGIPCHVEGREIGAGLIRLVNRYKVSTLDALHERLTAYAERECAKLIAKGREAQAEGVMDRVETIFAIMNSQPPATTVEELRQRIASMFVDGDDEVKPTLTLSTVHKSKGREWQKVCILGRNDFMPSPRARQQWEIEQEHNLIYVAVTRAQNTLVLVNGVPA